MEQFIWTVRWICSPAGWGIGESVTAGLYVAAVIVLIFAAMIFSKR